MASQANRQDAAQPFNSGIAVTPSDSTVLPETAGIYCGGAGNLVLTMDDGTVITLAVIAGSYHPLRANKVRAATTATGVVALYRNFQ